MIHSRITLNDVAAAAGVSVSTASRALSGQAERYRIRESTAKQIQAEAARLGFRPSRVARSLRLQRTGLIGVIVPDVSNPFFSAIAREVTLAAEDAGYSVLLADSQEETGREQKLLGELIAREVEAVVACPVGMDESHLLDAMHGGLPLVLVDRAFPNSSFLQVTSAHEMGAAKAVGLLTSRGHRDIGILQGLPGTFPNEARLRGSRKAIESVGMKWLPERVSGDNFTEESGYQSTRLLLKKHPAVTALFAMSMPNALGALRAAKEVGRSVPQDLSLVAFDDSPFADLLEVPITTVVQDICQLGRKAAQLAMERLTGRRASRKKFHEIKVTVRQRDSILKLR